MTGNGWVGAVVACFCAAAIGVSAQAPPGSTAAGPAPPPGSRTGNPTPGTPQPDPPSLADRITLTGCVQAAVDRGARGATDPGNPSDSRFVLTKADRKNAESKIVARSSTVRTYRLNAIDSQLSPFVGTKVEISGEVLASAPGGDPDPTRTVYIGRMTWEEMMAPFFALIVPRDVDGATVLKRGNFVLDGGA